MTYDVVYTALFHSMCRIRDGVRVGIRDRFGVRERIGIRDRVFSIELKNCLKFCYCGFFYVLLTGKKIDCYQMLQLHADACKGPTSQIIASSTKNCPSYPMFSLLVDRLVGLSALKDFSEGTIFKSGLH